MIRTVKTVLLAMFGKGHVADDVDENGQPRSLDGKSRYGKVVIEILLFVVLCAYLVYDVVNNGGIL